LWHAEPRPGTLGLPSKSGDRVPGMITGFETIPWGATRGDVEQRLGRPDATAEVVHGTELAYRVERRGGPAECEFTVHRDHGLIVGCLVLPVGSRDGAAKLFRDLRDDVSASYPGIEPIEECETDDEEGEALPCEQALAQGEASWCVEWQDPDGDARIELLIWPGAEVFWLTYYGPHADEWEEERFQQELMAQHPSK